jgi:uncharacterized protein YjeT (DUF2065 family)
MLGMAAAILVSPERLKKGLRIFLDEKEFWLATGIRIVVGVLFLMAASGTRAPSFITAVGILFIVAGVAIPFIGRARIERLANWWLDKPDGVLRTWAVAAGALGGVFVWCGL